MELSVFVEGALTGRLRFAPALGRTMPLEVAAAVTHCWACGCETRIATRLTFAAGKVLPGCPDIHASIYDFGDEVAGGAGILASMLPNTLLGRYGIGAIKRRYSRTEGRAYLSNGCLHCDALQGRFYDHDVRYDAETVSGVEVVFDPAWAGQLTEAQDAIERWWFDEAVRRAVARGTEPTPAAWVGDRLRAWRRSR